MLYETAARASEILALNVEDPDLEQRRAPIRSKGGDTEFVYWDTVMRPRTCCPRLLRPPDGTSRTSGPLFLAARRPVSPPPPATAWNCTSFQLITAKTRHKSPRTAMRYVKPGDAAVAEVTSLLGPPRHSHSARPLLCGGP